MKILPKSIKFKNKVPVRRCRRPVSESFVQSIGGCDSLRSSAVTVLLPQVLHHRRINVWNYEAHYTTRFKHSPALQQEPLGVLTIEMLEYMGTINCRDAVTLERQGL